MSKKLVSVLAAMIVLAAVSPATAAGSAFLKIKGQKTGDFKGGVTQKGREGWIQVLAATDELVAPRDASSGLATGKRQHKPFTVTVEADRALPLVFKAIASNENLPEVDIAFSRPNNAGMDTPFYTVKLTNASISSVKFVQPNTADAAQRSLPQQVEIAFTYQRIDWTWNEGGIAASDNWN